MDAIRTLAQFERLVGILFARGGRGVGLALIAGTVAMLPGLAFANPYPNQPSLAAPTNLHWTGVFWIGHGPIMEWTDNCSSETNYQVWYRRNRGPWTLYATQPAAPAGACLEVAEGWYDVAVRAVRISNGQVVAWSPLSNVIGINIQP
jgi:hypothetical protein